MKKTLTGLISLTTITGVVTPLVLTSSCTCSSKFVDVTVVDTTEPVTLEKTKAEKGKRFATKVSFDSSFYMNKVTVKVGNRFLKEGDLELGDENEFSYDYVNNILTIREGVIDAPVELSFSYTVVFTDTVRYVAGHTPYLISNEEIFVIDTAQTYTFYLSIDLSGWPEFYKEQFPQYFCFSRNSQIEYNGTFVADEGYEPQILNIPKPNVNVTLIDDGKGNVNKCFQLSGADYNFANKDNLHLIMFMQCKFDSSNHFRFYGLNK